MEMDVSRRHRGGCLQSANASAAIIRYPSMKIASLAILQEADSRAGLRCD